MESGYQNLIPCFLNLRAWLKIMIILQITLIFIGWLRKLKLNKITPVQKDWEMEEAAMDMVPWDSQDLASSLPSDT